MAMEKLEFKRRLDATGTTQALMCRDLGVHQTTAMRWKRPPVYAVAYLIALELMDKKMRLEWQHRIALEKMDDE